MDIRWLIRRDMPEVLRIESEAFDFPWDEDEFMRALQHKRVIALVAEENNKVIGYILYEFQDKRFAILNLAVSPNYIMQGVATALIEKLKAKLDSTRAGRNSIRARVRERNIPAQKLFAKCGFAATGIDKAEHDCHIDEDDYIFVYRREVCAV